MIVNHHLQKKKQNKKKHTHKVMNDDNEQNGTQMKQW